MDRVRGGALKECAGRLKKKADGTLQTSTEHAPDTAKNESEKIKATIHDGAENGVENLVKLLRTAQQESCWNQPIFCRRIHTP
jgi:hypothetical protein